MQRFCPGCKRFSEIFFIYDYVDKMRTLEKRKREEERRGEGRGGEYGGRVPLLDEIADGRLHENGLLGEALGVHLVVEIVEAHTVAHHAPRHFDVVRSRMVR